MKRNRKIIERVRQRDGGCVICGREEGLDVHHVDTWGAHGSDDPDRMITLCRICHGRWHEGNRELRRAVEAHLQRVTQPNWVAAYSFGFPMPEDLL